MAQIAIRCCAAADRPDALALLVAQLREHESSLPDDAVASALDGMLDRPDRGAVLIATLDGRAVGIAVLSTMWTLEHGGQAVWLDELYVEPAERGHGIGRALLAAAYATAREYGAATVDLEVVAGHERAGVLYEREGFERLPRVRWIRRLG
jgi:GNAT superfamily N-acetyltransferase